MKQKFYYILYVSTATRHFSKNDLLALLETSRRNNAKLDITGMLLYKDDQFQQVLEGPEEAVKAVYEKVRKDHRHHGVINALDGYEAERQFTDWSMGFCDLGSAEAAAVPGYNPFLNTPLADETFIANPSLCWKLMLMFKKGGG